ncbi:hypothetical protein WG902_01870 [Ramlibacter sp. PS3R-8]|uniref:hypothetical protein n=1 Tax=Ramlibacter sp. PS3R-8 TaxID=3133437 RepID=UPI0030A4327C
MHIHTTAAWTAVMLSVIGVGGFAGEWSQVAVDGVAPVVAVATAAATPAGTTAAAAVAAVKPAVVSIAFNSEEELRAKMKWVAVKYGGERVQTLDEESCLLLAQAAAERAGLHKVGLSYEDVYGLINAETSWIPRSGMGKNGVASMGLAQFEPRTAKGLGLKDPNDPVQAVYFAAINMKHGAQWASDRIAHLKLTPDQYALKMREGVSIYYNLSVKGRNKWDGTNTTDLPIETQRHIQNVRTGAEKAADLAEEIWS